MASLQLHLRQTLLQQYSNNILWLMWSYTNTFISNACIESVNIECTATVPIPHSLQALILLQQFHRDLLLKLLNIYYLKEQRLSNLQPDHLQLKFFYLTICCRRNMIHCLHSVNNHNSLAFFNFLTQTNEFFSTWLRR